MRTTVDLPDPLFREVKMLAGRQGMKMKELLTAFIEEGLRSGKNSRKAVARSPLPIARQASGVHIPALSNSEIAKILDSEDSHARH